MLPPVAGIAAGTVTVVPCPDGVAVEKPKPKSGQKGLSTSVSGCALKRNNSLC